MKFRTLPFVAFILPVMAGSINVAFARTDEIVPAVRISDAGHQHYARPDQVNQRVPDQAAPRLLNLGSHTFPVSVRNKLAQKYMNQGLNLSYAFNHAEAGLAFREAAQLEPSLAMAYWGQALVLGPNINAPMDPGVELPALELVRKAASLMSTASPRERALIGALERRYTGD